jgi:hypothetical protein
MKNKATGLEYRREHDKIYVKEGDAFIYCGSTICRTPTQILQDYLLVKNAIADYLKGDDS